MDTFTLLVSFTVFDTVSEFIDNCRALGFVELQYVNIGLDEKLPDFDNGYMFEYKTDDKVTANLEVLEKDGMILQAGIQVIYPKSLLFKRMPKHFEKVVTLADDFYGTGMLTKSDSMEIVNYGNEETVFYVSKVTVNRRDALTFRVGNKQFWR